MTVELEVPKHVAERVIDQMNYEAQRMENVLQSYRSNEMTGMVSYDNLLDEQEALVAEIEDLEEQLEEDSPDGLGELFG